LVVEDEASFALAAHIGLKAKIQVWVPIVIDLTSRIPVLVVLGHLASSFRQLTRAPLLPAADLFGIETRLAGESWHVLSRVEHMA
jgi:hypothetical protein